MPKHTILIAVLAALTFPSTNASSQPDWQIHRDSGDRDVVERYREILHSDPMSERGFDGLVAEYRAHGGLESLISEYAQAVADSPDDTTGLIILARLRTEADQNDNAVLLLNRATDLGVATAELFVFRGQLHMSLAQATDAEADFEVALSQAQSLDHRIEILALLADAQLSIDSARAMDTYGRIADLAPRDRYVRMELGQILYSAGFLPEALEQYREVVRLAGTNTRDRANAFREVATLEEELEHYEQATQTWNGVIEITEPGNWLRAEAEEGLVRTYRAWGRLDLFVEQLDARTSNRTRDPFVLYSRARILTELDRQDEARQAFSFAIERRPADPDFQFEYAQALLEWGDVSAARELIGGLISRWPDRLELMWPLVDHYIEGDQRYEASFLLRSHQSAAWDDPGLLWELADRYRLISDSSAARNALDRLVELSPDDFRPILRMAEQSIQDGDLDGAMAFFAPILTSGSPEQVEDVVGMLREAGHPLRAEGVVWEARDRFPENPRITLLWLRESRNESQATMLAGARDIVLMADDWETVREAFELYRGLLDEADMLSWAAGHFQATYDASPTDYHTGRLALMLHIAAGDSVAAGRTHSMLAGTVPSSIDPDLWVLATLQEWPNPNVLPLLRRLGSNDLSGSWRWEIQRARLLAEAGRTDQARTTLERTRETARDNPAVLYEIGDVFLSLPTDMDASRGCALIQEALDSDERNLTYRLASIDCVREAGRVDDAYGLALDGFQYVRDVSAAELLFDRLVLALPAQQNRQEVERALRRVLRHANHGIQAWLDSAVSPWAGS